MSRRAGGFRGAKPTWTTTSTSGIFGMEDVVDLKAVGQWPRGPVAPTSLAGTPGDGQVALTWVAPATTHGTITDYIVEYTPAAGSPTLVATGSTAASYTLTGLTNYTEYTFRVAAMNHTRGDFSSSVAVTPSGLPVPQTISGLQLWLDASDASTLYDATTGGSLVAADGAVARWEDKSGNETHATQSDANGKPTRKVSLLNGNDGLRLSTDQMLVDVSYATTDHTFFIAVKPTSTSGGIRYYLDSEGPGNLVFCQAANGAALGWYDGTWRAPAAASLSSSDQVVCFRLDSSSASGEIFRNGTSLGTAPYSAKPIGGDVGLLAAAFAYNYGNADGDVYEMILYEGALIATDREAVENYLMTKWGIS